MIAMYDSTLRDGEQREGVALTLEDKLHIASRLDALGIQYIEGGFPGSNPKDDEFFKHSKELELTSSTIVAFGSTCRKGTDAADDAGLSAILASGVTAAAIVGKASLEHVERALETTGEENLRMVHDSVAFLHKGGIGEVFFDAEHFFDGYKTNKAYTLSVLAAAIDGGADTLTLCDTNGGSMPNEIFAIVEAVCSAFPQARIAIHTHNDCGCAVANSLEAVRAGATIVQGTINGYGERVGNADLTAIIPDLELKCGIPVIGPTRLEHLTGCANAVAEIFNVAPDAHHPYVGSSAFAHKGGLHASAAAKFAGAYEHIDPRQVGNLSHVVVSELAGRASLVSKAAELGVDLSEEPELASELLGDIKSLESGGYSFEVADASLALLLNRKKGLAPVHFRLESFRVIAEKREDGRIMTEATIKIHVGNQRFVATGEGNGPVNALDVALRMAITQFYPEVSEIELTDFKVRVLDESLGTDAITRVAIESSDGKSIWGTVGVSENIIEASWNALIDSIEYGLRDVTPL
jgi:2-isopropylmalate synthase